MLKKNLVAAALVTAFAGASSAATFEWINRAEGPADFYVLKKTTEGKPDAYIFSGKLSGAYAVETEHLSDLGRFVINSATNKDLPSDDGTGNRWTDVNSLTFDLAPDFSGGLVTKADGSLAEIQVNRGHELILNGGSDIQTGSIWIQRSQTDGAGTGLTVNGLTGETAGRTKLTVNGDIINFASSGQGTPESGKLTFGNADVVVTGSVGVQGAGESGVESTPFEELEVTLTNATFKVGGDLLGTTISTGEGSTSASIDVAGTMSGRFDLGGATVSAGALQVEDGNSTIGELVLQGDETKVTVEGESTLGLTIGKVTGEGGVGLGANSSVTMTDVAGNVDLVFHDKSASAEIDGASTGDVTLVVGEELNDGTQSIEDLVSEIAGKVTDSSDVMNDFVVQEGAGDNLTGSASGTLGQDNTVENIVVNANTTVTALGELADLSFMQWRAEANDVNLRLGDLRASTGTNGLWARTYGGKNEYGSSSLENEFYALQVGYDHLVSSTGAKVWVGGAASYTEGDSAFTNGTGDNNTLAVTLYGSWLFEGGSFLDVWGKYGTLKSTFDKVGGYHGDYDTQGAALGIEGGHRFALAERFYVEPQVEVIWSKVFSETFDAGNNVTVKQNGAESFVARAGAAFGMTFPDNKGAAYVRASYAYDFDGETAADFYGAQHVRYDNDLGGGWYELGIGANVNVTDATHLYVDFEYEDGGEIDTPYRWNVGIRHTW